MTSYNTFSPGPWTDDEHLPPFVLSLDKLDVQFNDTPGRVLRRRPRSSRRTTTFDRAPRRAPDQAEISVNHPVTIDGADVFLLGNGYTPVITVRNAAGEVLYREATPFLAQDANYRSVGVVKVSSLPAPKQLGLTGFFLPTAEPTFANGPVSLFPDTNNPELALSAVGGHPLPRRRTRSRSTRSTPTR